MQKRIIALTGGIASGKSTVADTLREQGVPVVDADAISRALTAQGGQALPAIRAAFGDGVFLPDGQLDRRALGRVVFEDGTARERLNAILHPLIRQEMQRQIEACPSPLVVLDVPLLYESGMQDMADAVWCVYCPQSEQLSRVMARDGLTESEALARIRSQWPAERKLALAQVAIRTDRPMEETRSEVLALLRHESRR